MYKKYLYDSQHPLMKFPKDSETLALYSLEDALGRCGISTKDVTRMRCQVNSIDSTRQYLLAPDISKYVSRFELEIYGYGKIPEPHLALPTTTFYPTEERLTSHHTLIEIKNKPTMLWYEPQHDMSKTPIITGGGFLIDISSSKSPEKVKELYATFDNIRNQHFQLRA